MRVEPTIDRAALMEVIGRQYGLRVESLTFFPHSWVSSCYIVHCEGGARYFLKLYKTSGWAPFVASDLDFYLPLTYDLRTKGILPNIAAPIRTCDGHLRTRFERYHLILFNFIAGAPLGYDSLPDDVLTKLAQMIGILHRSTPKISVESPHTERFDIVFEDALVHSLNVLAGITSGARRGQQALRDLLLPRRGELLDLLRRLKALRERARTRDQKMVVCHTDLHGGNLMLDDQGELYILDWEGAIMAPPEHDLFVFAWEARFWNLFLPNYEREFGPVSLDPDVFGFYYYRRNLEDLADWVVRILYENTEDAQDTEDLQGIAEDCLAGWPYLNATIETIRARHQKHRNHSHDER